MLPSADDTSNLKEIEMQWAVKAMTHAEIYMNILKSRPAESIQLTPIDDELYKDFREEFPTLNIKVLDEKNDFKSEAAKRKWRNFMNKYEKRVADFSFGTLMRIDSQDDYTEENSMFTYRLQFLCIEIARLREGYNDKFYTKPS
ncbi:hypothetical protein BB560_002946 [Smittium megazygosporum]|uniref:Polysaccharide biosynthesis domain-containing protein n=1 Tax=Smittium megazygosporum TaxID=133381 RepID=A0A2T9ZDI5_9FUNG|nr:hypothetical protein BB560_002946 [Smittium megazygosporum]